MRPPPTFLFRTLALLCVCVFVSARAPVLLARVLECSLRVCHRSCAPSTTTPLELSVCVRVCLFVCFTFPALFHHQRRDALQPLLVCFCHPGILLSILRDCVSRASPLLPSLSSPGPSPLPSHTPPRPRGPHVLLLCSLHHHPCNQASLMLRCVVFCSLFFLVLPFLASCASKWQSGARNLLRTACTSAPTPLHP